MATGLPDLVDCARLAADAAVLERVYGLGELPRIQEFLAASGVDGEAGADGGAGGSIRARYVFSKLASGRAGAAVSIEAAPRLVCQRCLQGFVAPLNGGSDVEFAGGDAVDDASAERELFRIDNGRVSLRELAEEEMLLALPIVPACATPLTCGNAPPAIVAAMTGAGDGTGDGTGDGAGTRDGAAEKPGAAADEIRRPFAGLQDLMKKPR